MEAIAQRIKKNIGSPVAPHNRPMRWHSPSKLVAPEGAVLHKT
jgi:hypothetical protein